MAPSHFVSLSLSLFPEEPPSHEELLEEARRCLELARERLELRERLQEAA